MALFFVLHVHTLHSRMVGLNAFSALLTITSVPSSSMHTCPLASGPTLLLLPPFSSTFAHVAPGGTLHLTTFSSGLLLHTTVFVFSVVFVILVLPPPLLINLPLVPFRVSSSVTQLTPRAIDAMTRFPTVSSHPDMFISMSCVFLLNRNSRRLLHRRPVPLWPTLSALAVGVIGHG